MNKLKNMSESSFLKLFMGFISACFVIAAFLMPDRANAFSGLWQIASMPGKITTKGKGGMSGDAIFEEVEPIVEAITPVPGGVGAVTTSVLMKHVVEAAERA